MSALLTVRRRTKLAVHDRRLDVPIDSVIRVMQIKSIVRRHPRGGATSPARGVQPPSRSYDDVEPDTDVVLKVFKFNISPRCKRRRRESNPQARTHTKPRIVQSNSRRGFICARTQGRLSVATRGSSMENKCETSIILCVQQRRWLRRVKYRGGCGVEGVRVSRLIRTLRVRLVPVSAPVSNPRGRRRRQWLDPPRPGVLLLLRHLLRHLQHRRPSRPRVRMRPHRSPRGHPPRLRSAVDIMEGEVRG